MESSLIQLESSLIQLGSFLIQLESSPNVYGVLQSSLIQFKNCLIQLQSSLINWVLVNLAFHTVTILIIETWLSLCQFITLTSTKKVSIIYYHKIITYKYSYLLNTATIEEISLDLN